MAVETLDAPPCSFRAGETVRFTVSDNDHPASTWTGMNFTLRGKSLLTVAAVASGDDFIVTLTKVQTAALLPGPYNFVAIYTDASLESEAGDTYGVLQVLPNLADTTVGPARTAYLAALAAWQALGARQFQSVSVEGESYTLQSIDSLWKVVSLLQLDALREDKERGLTNQGGLVRIQMRM